jgi:shikimate dehydrogenase
MNRYAVIGHPIAHSKSPFIHSAFGRASGCVLSYDAIDISAEQLSAQLAALHAEGYAGVNVTLPHKVAVQALCEGVSARAEAAGAVNTLSRTDTGWLGDNTDGAGFLADIARLGFSLSGAKVLILGAGGAARGLIAPILGTSPKELVVSNRNPWKPEELAERYKHLGNILPRTHLSLKGDRYDVVINATAAGHSGEMVRLPGPILQPGGVAYDLSYGAAAAPFMAWARAQGARLVSDGLGMLVEQAAEAFAHWHGLRPTTATVLAALREPEEAAIHQAPQRATQPNRKEPD